MNINKFNYEVFALDYLEGNLAPELAEEMERFIKTHPAIDAELAGMAELVFLEPDYGVNYEHKAALKRSEQVVFLNRKWVRSLVAAASILLLLATYFMGYRAGEKQGENLVARTIEKENKEKENHSKIPAEINPNEEEINPVVLTETNKKNMHNEVLEPTFSNSEKSVKPAIRGEKAIVKIPEQELNINSGVEKIARETMVAEKIKVNKQVVENQLIVEVDEAKNTLQTILKNLPVAPLPLLNRNLPIKSNKDIIADFDALALDLPIDKEWLATIQKKKRSIKNILGRFPVGNLKDAIIPSYYKEENAGQ